MNGILLDNDIAKKLLERYQNKELSRAEFEMETAWWLVSILDTMRFKRNPPAPDAVVDYRRRKDMNPSAIVSNEFWNQPEVKGWSSKCSSNRAENISNWHWLLYMKHRIPKNSPEYQKILEVMASYEHQRIQGTL